MDTLSWKKAGLIYGPQPHYLDHLGPLCAILQIPLIVTEEEIALTAKKYYPDLNCILYDYLAVAEYVVSHFEIIFYSMPRDLFDEVFFFAQQFLRKQIHTIWVPHGNSDKGAHIFFMEALKKEKAALVYGKQMIDTLQKKGVYDSLEHHVITGNFRYQYFLKHSSFYASVLKEQIQRKFSFQARKTLLYAPTWQDVEKSSSFFEAIGPLIKNLPKTDHLIVKLHPNLKRQEEFQIEEMLENFQDSPNVLFLTEFSPIYALLSLVDIYIGDMSSVGYDFLTFDRPLFFLNQNKRDITQDMGLYLFRCGIEILPEKYAEIHKIIGHYFQFELRDFSTIRKEVYTYAFGHPKSLETLQKEIEHLCLSIQESER